MYTKKILRTRRAREYEKREDVLFQWITPIISFLGGIIGAICIALPIQALLLPNISLLSVISLIVGLTEEPFKPVGLVLIARKHHDRIRTKKLYMVGGAWAGLGFGVVENLIYYFKFGPGVLPARVGISLPMHVGMSAFVGVGIYFAIIKKEYWKFIWLLLFAATIHAIFNFIALTATQA